MMPSSRQGLNGIKKVGTCRRSFICLNDDCPIYTAERIRNKVDFVKEKFVHIHVPTANNLYNVGSAMHEKLLNLNTKTMY